jgi:UDP-GlcNAc:undecaprenyl-phosphate GlcNAc-1-phosphate transferase
MIGITIAAVCAGLVTWAVTPIVRRWAEKQGAVDQPGGRRINSQPLPRMGGIAIFLGFLLAVVLTVTARQLAAPQQKIWTLQVVGILAATTFAALAGLIDDLKNKSSLWQTLAIAMAGLILFAFGVRIEGVTNPLSWTLGQPYDPRVHWHALGLAASGFVTIFWVFVVTKTVDFIDGVDGLAAGVCAISAATLALMSAQLHTAEGLTLPLIASAMVGACLGFLRHNYHPAKIIMGTVGAWVLGIPLAAISILGAFKVAAAVSVLVPVLVLGVPLFDSAHVLTRRLLERAPLTQADKRHLHHRLLERGWNQRQVVWFIYSVALLLCGAALAIFYVGRR